MKLVRFSKDGKVGVGAVIDDGVIDIALHDPSLSSLESLLTPQGQRKAAAVVASHGATFALNAVRLLRPVVRSSRIFCVGVNYKSHLDETGRDMPPRPSVFIRLHESLVDPGQSIRRPKVSSKFDYEGELAAVIGTAGRNLTEEVAIDHVAGYTCFNDGSIRDYQKISVTAGKNFQDSGSCGPWVVTSDELPDPTTMTLVTRLNGVEVQRSGTNLLIYSVPLIIAFISEMTELLPGDIIATGTPAGVGHRRDPQLWMKPGDRVDVDISGVGLLSNTVEDQQ
jgi:2-keto-4-pentenoate hydratase/2-oxohepta-3-ene-1,7-dioic acid hydratase in catechol pathway